MNERTKIGFLDSGVGGITVLADAVKALPAADYLFYADSDHVPYGTKTPAEVTSYCMDALGFLAEQGAEAVVVACNTATSMAIRTLRDSFPFPIVGMEPAVKPAAEGYPNGKILVCATPLTIGGEKLHTLIDRSFRGGPGPVLRALPELVALAEREDFSAESAASVLRSSVGHGEGYVAVVLGCTHFLYFREDFRAFFPGADIIDGNAGTVRRLADLVPVRPAAGNGSIRFFTSGREEEPGGPGDERYRRYLARAFCL